ncbi:GSCOCG00005632001-RA-CDS, partial [Cotesia congregata]
MMMNFRIIKMQEFCLLFLVFCFLVSSAMIEEKKEDNFSKLSKILVHIIKSCEKDYHAAVINKRTDESVSRHLGNLESIAVNFQDNLLVSIFDDDFSYGKEKIDLFIATIENSVDELKKMLHQLKFSRWWDIMMPHFIINGSDNGCKHASTALKMIWRMNILNGYYICFDFKRKPFIYTFNPYSSRAPDQWKIVEEVSNASYYLAIYNRQYDRDGICKDFYFDRTKYVEKFLMRIGIPSQMENLQGGSYIISAMKNVFKLSLVNMTFLCYTREYWWFFYLHAEDELDILLCPTYTEHDKWKDEFLRASYPTNIEGLYILSSNQKYLSPLEKIYSSFDFPLILGTIIITIITYLVILFTNSNRRYLFTTFEIIRLWIGVSLKTKINPQSLRIFFSSIFIYFLVIQMTIQGDLVDCLSKTKLEKNVNYLSDLRNNYYQKIFLNDQVPLAVFDDELILKTKIQADSKDNVTCIENVIKDPSKICITYYNDVLLELQKNNFTKNALKSLHLSKYSISTRLGRYATPFDWPLKKKFDNLLMSIESYGLNLKTEANNRARLMSDLQTSEYVTSFSQISLDSLSFVFFFWFAGITLSFICFFFETFDISKKYILNCICATKKEIFKFVTNILKFLKNVKSKI